jgi:hypothetical protein
MMLELRRVLGCRVFEGCVGARSGERRRRLEVEGL